MKSSVGSQPAGAGEAFARVVERRLRRRSLLRGGVGLGALVLLGPTLAACQAPWPRRRAAGIWFAPIRSMPADHDQPVVAPGHAVEPLLKWGDPILADAPSFDPAQLSA